MSIILDIPVYTVRHSTTVTSSTQALILLQPPSSVFLVPIRAWCAATTDATSRQQEFRIVHFATTGSGGTGLTVDAHQRGFGAALSSAVYNPTTGGASLQDTIDQKAANFIGQGYEWDGQGIGWTVPPSGVLQFELVASPSSATLLSFGLVFGEIA